MAIFNLKDERERNRDDVYYYNRENPGLSASTLKKYHPDYKYKSDKPGEFKHPLVFGDALHKSVLENDKYLEIDWEAKGLTEDDLRAVEALYGAIMLYKPARDIILHKDVEYEVPDVAMHEDYLLKCKIDIALPEADWDIKTTSAEDERAYEYMASQLFMYPLSNYHYYLIRKKPMHFIVVSKTTNKVWLSKTDNQFYAYGRKQWNEAWSEFKQQNN